MAGVPMPEGFTEVPAGEEPVRSAEVPPMPDGFTEEAIQEEDASTLGPSAGVPVTQSTEVVGFSAQDLSAEVEKNRTEKQATERAAQLERLNTAFASPLWNGEDDAAKTLSIAKRLGLPFDTVRDNLKEFQRTAEEAEFNAEEWTKRNPSLAKLLNRHHELAPAVLRSKDVGDLTRKWEQAKSWLVEKLDLLSPEDIEEQKQLTETLNDSNLSPEQLDAEMSRTEQNIRVRREVDLAQATMDRQALEVDDPLARIIRNKSGIDYLNAIAWQRTAEGLHQNKRAMGFEELMRARFLEEHGGKPARPSLEIEIELHDDAIEHPTRAFGDDSGAGRVVGVAAQGISSTVGAGAEGIKAAGVVGGGSGLVLGGITYGITKSPSAAADVAMGAGKVIGGAAGKGAAMLSMYRMETGGSYERNLSVVTEEGKHLTNDEAMAGAVLEGLFKSALENFSFSKQANLYKSALPNAVSAALRRDPTFRRMITHVAKEYFESIATETITEGLQTGIEEAGEYLTKSAAQGKLAKGPVFKGGIVPSMEAGALGAIVLGGVPSAVQIIATPTVQKSSKLALERTKEERAAKNDEVVGPVLDMAQHPVVQSAPDQFATMIDEGAQEHGAPLKSFHVTAEEIRTFFQKDTKEERDRALVDATGDESAPQRLDDALEQGTKFEIPIQQVLARWGASDLGKAMRPHTSTSATEMSPQQREDNKAALKEQTKLVEEGVGEEISAEEEAVLEQEKIEQSVAEIRGEKEAKRVGMLFAHFWRTTASDTKGKHTAAEIAQQFLTRFFKGNELSSDQSGRTEESMVDPDIGETGDLGVGEDAGAAILEAVNQMSPEERGEKLFIDKDTGLRSERAWRMTERTPGKQVMVITTPDMKAINDDPAGGHDTTNDLLRVIAREVVKFDPTAAVSGPNFKLEIDPGKEGEIAAAVQAAMPEGVVIDFGAGATDVEATAAADSMTEKKRAAGEYGPRGSTKYNKAQLAEPGFRFSTEADTIKGKVSDALQANVASGDAAPGKFEETGSFIKEAMYDPRMPGTLTGTGFDAVGERDHVLAIDGVGLRDLNLALGKEAGNVYLAAIASVARDIGGEGLFFTHKSGDEYAAKSDNLAALESFARDLHSELKQLRINVTVNGKQYVITPDIRFGIGEKTYGAADRALNTAKRAEKGSGVVRGPAFREAGGQLDQLPERGDLAALGRRAEARRGEQTDAIGARTEGAAAEDFDPESLSPGSSRGPSKSEHTPEQMKAAREGVERMQTRNRLRFTRFLDFVEGWANGAERPKQELTMKEERKLAERYGIVDPEFGFAQSRLDQGKQTAQERSSGRGRAPIARTAAGRAVQDAQRREFEERVLGRVFPTRFQADASTAKTVGAALHDEISSRIGANAQQMSDRLVAALKGVDLKFKQTPQYFSLEDIGVKGPITNIELDPMRDDSVVQLSGDGWSTEGRTRSSSGGVSLSFLIAKVRDQETSNAEQKEANRKLAEDLLELQERHGFDVKALRWVRFANKLGQEAIDEFKKGRATFAWRAARNAAATEVELRQMVDNPPLLSKNRRAPEHPLTWRVEQHLNATDTDGNGDPLVSPEEEEKMRNAPAWGALLRDLEDAMTGVARSAPKVLFQRDETTGTRNELEKAGLQAIREDPQFEGVDEGWLLEGQGDRFAGTSIYLENDSGRWQITKRILSEDIGGDQFDALSPTFDSSKEAIDWFVKDRKQDAAFKKLLATTKAKTEAKNIAWAKLEKEMADKGISLRDNNDNAVLITPTHGRALGVGGQQETHSWRVTWFHGDEPAGHVFADSHPEALRKAREHNADPKTAQEAGKLTRLFQPDDDFRDSHRAPKRGTGSPASDLTEIGTYPADVYSANGPRYYGFGFGNDAAARAIFKTLNEVRGKPDAEVSVYRAVPTNVKAKNLMRGDWVSLSKEYAADHGERRFDGKYRVIEQKVRAGDIFTNGDSIFEFGYDPERGGLSEVKAKAEAEGVKFDASEKDGIITLSRIVVPEDKRSTGVGTRMMEMLTSYADQSGQKVALTPSTDFGASSKSRLQEFYKRFGFRENKGRSKDFTTRETMIREPSKRQLQDEDSSIPRGYTMMPDVGQGRRLFDVFLNKKADASTAIHEAAHVFLEILGDMAKRADATERTRKKWLDTLKWMGTTEEKWHALSPKEQSDLHEKFAEAFEVYMSEGSAPSQSLEGVFVRFRDWILDVFKTLTRQRAPINDDIRSVFDRLLATDEEIKRHQGQRGRPLFDNAKDAGMTDAQWADKLEADAEQRHFANRKVWLRAKLEQLREKNKQWKEELRAEEKAAEQRYDKLPAVTAQKVLDGTLAGTDAIVLDRKQVVEAVGRREARNFRTAVTGGRNIDEVGIAAAFPNGKAMLEAIVALPAKDDWVAQEADAAMKQKHGDLLTQRDSLRKEVQDGMHSVVEKQQLEEWAQLNKGLKPGMGAPVIPAEAIRDAAKNMMERRAVKSLSGPRVLQAERTAATAKAAHAAKGEIDMATAAAKKQLLNSFLYKETLKALDEKEELEDHAKKLSKSSAQAKLGKAAKEYRDATNFILESLGLKAPTGAPNSINGAVAMMNGSGFAIGDPEWLGGLNGVLRGEAAYRTGDRMAPLELGNLTVKGMRAVKDALKSLEAAAQDRNTTLREGKRVDIEESEKKIIANIESTKSKLPAPVTKGTETAGEELRALLNGADAFLRNPIDMARSLVDNDQESELFKVLINPVRRGKYRENELLRDAIKPLVDAMERIPAAMKKQLNAPIDGPALFPDHTKDFSPPRYRHELLVMALNYGNESNAQRLRDGRNITDTQVRAALNTLTKEELAWVQQVFDSAEKLRPEAFALEERLTGLPVKAIQARPVKLSNGTLAGGYFPAVYERAASVQGERQNAASVLDPNYTRPSTPHSHLKSRADKVSAVISLSVGNVYRGLAQTAHDIAYREALLSASSMVLRPKVQQALKQRLGPDAVEYFMRWYSDIGGAKQGPRNEVEKTVAWIRGNMAPAILGFKLSNALGDFANLLAAVPSTALKVKHLSDAVNACLREPRKSRELALKESAELRLMSDTLRKQYNEQVRDFTKRGVFDRGPLAWLKDNAFVFQETVQHLTATPIWLGAYRQAATEGKPHDEAVRWANDILTQVFPSHSPVEQSALMRDKGYVGLTTVFGGYLNTVYRANARIVSPLFTTAFEHAGLLEKSGAVLQVAGALTAFTVAWQLFGELFMGKGAEAGDDDDEDPDSKLLRWRNWAARKLVTAPMQTLPLVSEIATTVDSVMADRQPHGRGGIMAEFVMSLGRGLQGAFGEDKEAIDRLESIWRILGATKGMPQGMNPTLRYLLEVGMYDRAVPTPFHFGAGVTYGERENQPANVPAAAGDTLLDLSQN